MRLFRSHKMPRRSMTATVIRRRADGTLWCAHHDGAGAVLAWMVAVTRGDESVPRYSFRRVRRRGGIYVASARVAWRHSTNEFDIVDVNASIRMIG